MEFSSRFKVQMLKVKRFKVRNRAQAFVNWGTSTFLEVAGPLIGCAVSSASISSISLKQFLKR